MNTRAFYSIDFAGGDESQVVHTVFCIGRNYVAHAKELNNPVPSQPLVFQKPISALSKSGTDIVLPQRSKDVHYECEIVVAIGKTAKNVAVAEALDYVAGYGLGIDITARDIQQQAKDKGHPWTVAKGFDSFAPLSDFIPAGSVKDPAALRFQLDINGERRQNGDSAKMIFPVAYLISYLSEIFTLLPGTLIFTGTPEGVGPLKSGDHLMASLENHPVRLETKVRR